jgi:hypothetical protein
MPLGYYHLRDVERIPFDRRPNDVLFAGSVESRRGFTLRPRLISRRQMAAALDRSRALLPQLRVDYSSAGPFASPEGMLGPEAYSRRLAESRIVLCPRGNFDETFRLGEAARSGCVAIAERLPSRWYYDGAPVIQLDRWAELPELLAELVADPVALAERGERMRAWWDSTLSERAVARWIARSLGGAEGD